MTARGGLVSGASALLIAMLAGCGGSGGGTTDEDEHGAILATLSFGLIDLAASGRFHLVATYAFPDGSCIGIGGAPCQLRVDGTLPGRNDGPGLTSDYQLLDGLRMGLRSGAVEMTRIE